MTFVLGMATSNGVYLCADTKVTTRSNDDEVSTKKINQLKIQPINSHVMCAASGDAGLASFVINKLLSDKRVRSWNIDTIVNDLNKGDISYLANIVNEYRELRSTKTAVLTFAGKNPHRKMLVDMNKYKEMLDLYIASYQQHNGLSPDTAMHDSVLKGLLKSRKQFFSINKSRFTIYQISISFSKIHTEEFPFGTVAASGSIDLDLIDFGFVMGLEFRKEVKPMQNVLQMTSVIIDSFSSSIGGAVTPMLLNEDGIHVCAETVHRFNPKFMIRPVQSYSLFISKGIIYMKFPHINTPLVPVTNAASGEGFEI
jgi:hypothetical protein